MIKLKDILFESTAPDIFIPRRVEDRFERLIKNYVRNGSKGDLNLSGMNLTKLPYMLKDVNVDGDFWCANNKLTSLEGVPSSVGKSFFCANNQLISLKGAPTYVVGDFACGVNKLTSLECAPKNIGGTFSCIHNMITSLQGAPESVGKDFYFYKNTGKFTEKDIRAVCDVKGRVYV